MCGARFGPVPRTRVKDPSGPQVQQARLLRLDHPSPGFVESGPTRPPPAEKGLFLEGLQGGMQLWPMQ